MKSFASAGIFILFIAITSGLIMLPGYCTGQQENSIHELQKYQDLSPEQLRLIIDSLTTKYEVHCWKRIYCNCERRNPYKIDSVHQSALWKQKHGVFMEYIENLELALQLATRIDYTLAIARSKLFDSSAAVAC